MIVYVQRDGSGAIVGVYANPQPGYAVEALDDSDPAVAAFLAALVSGPTLAVVRTAADALLQSPGQLPTALRAVLLVAVDEINLLREWITTFKAAVAAATSLANLQTRVAALPNMPDYTAVQAKTAIQNKIDSAAAD